MNINLTTKFRISVFLFLFYLSASLMAQTGKITGKVTDGTEALIGATVVIEGTTTGTVTDLDGNYTIQAQAGETSLKFSSVGYLTEVYTVNVSEGSTTQLDVVLIEDIAKLDEVVVIGYGALKKSDLTGAVSTVEGEVLNTRVTEGVDKALQGVAAGVDVVSNSGSPGAAPAIRIRGTGTINNADPLFVVDGLMVGNIDFLNPNDVESISVLKDASATAIYGSRGANGVILITTKKGSAGEPAVNFSIYYGVQSVPNWVSMMNGPEYATAKNSASFFPVYDPETVESTNWLDQITQNGAPMYNANLSLSGGSENKSYLLSFGYFDQQGVIKRTSLKRYTLRANSEVQVKKWLKIGEDINLSFRNRDFVSENNTYNSIISQAMFADPITPVYDSLGNFQPLYTTADGNPLQKLEEATLDQNSKDSRLIGNLYAEFTILEGLTFKSSFGGEANYNEYYRYVPTYDFGLGNQMPDLTNNRGKYLSWQFENYATYSKTFGVHSLTVLAGTSATSWEWNDLRATNTAGPLNEDPALRYFFNWSRENDIIDGLADQASLYSWLGRINYGLFDKYLLTGSMRRDGSSKFGEKYRYGWFPSFAFAWKLHNEEFIKNINAISELKFRAGWGQIGNENIGTGGYVGTITRRLNYSEGETLLEGGTALGPPNPGLKWETTTSTNFGIDAGFFKNQLQFSVEYFIKNTSDMLARKDLPRISGIPPREFPVANVGQVLNKGLEISASYRKMEGNFQYTVGGFISKVVNRVVDLGGEHRLIYAPTYYGQGFGPLSVTREDYPIASFFGYQTEGIFQSYEEVNAHAYQNARTAPGDFKFKDLNGDGVITDRDQTFIGSPHPDFTYGFNLNLFYKNFDLDLTFNGVYGGKLFAPWKSFSHDALSGANNMHSDLNGAWQEDAPSSTTPIIKPIDYNQNLRLSDYYLEDATYFRFRTAQLGYTLPKTLSDAINVSNFRVYIGGQNLFTMTNYSGNDPEVGVTGSLLINVDFGNVPQPRVYTVGVDLSF